MSIEKIKLGIFEFTNSVNHISISFCIPILKKFKKEKAKDKTEKVQKNTHKRSISFH